MTLAASVIGGDRLSLARLLSHVENDTPEGRQALKTLFPRTGNGHLIGITGAPGTGKSSLVNQLALRFRSTDKRVAIAAVDPSSPFSGGAVLGDRIRMKDLSGHDDVFIRSMASRGALGGLARTTAAITQVFDAAGYEIILIETVGAGQGEVDIARLAHTTLVVEAPGMGDDIQAIKAGILEVADILVINKADKPGVDAAEKALRSVLEFASPGSRDEVHHGQMMERAPQEPVATGGWTVPIQRTIATSGVGIAELADQIEKHRAYLRASGAWAKRDGARLQAEVDARLQQALRARLFTDLPEGRYNEVMHMVMARQLSPMEAATQLTNELNPKGNE